MGIPIKEGLAATYPIGPFVDGSGIALGSLNIIKADIFLSKNGGILGTISGTPTAYADRMGYYQLVFDATDLNTKGPLKVAINKATALPVWHNFDVVGTQQWDAFFAGDRLQVDVRELGDATLDFTSTMKTAIGSQMLTSTISRVGSLPIVGTVAYVSGGLIGTVTFITDGLLGTVSRVLSVGSLAAGIVGTVSHATSVGSLSGIGATAQNNIADAILSRDVDNVEVAAPVHSLAVAILKAISRIRDNNGTLETYMTDGATIKMSQTITTDANNLPIDELTAGS